ncbi:hypothetical protein [Rhizobium laguerreae]|nr:hypothetical protein [Rhizobium laguerreae]
MSVSPALKPSAFTVEESIADRFVDLFCAGVARLKVGNPMERDRYRSNGA